MYYCTAQYSVRCTAATHACHDILTSYDLCKEHNCNTALAFPQFVA